MASNDEDQPTGTKPNPTVDDFVIITYPIFLPTNLVEEDGRTITSSLTSIELTNAPISCPSPVKHKGYEVLTGGRRPQLKTMPYKKKLIARILEVNKNSFLPSFMKESPVVLA